MKIIILAMDGLEYELVVSWKLRNLMQTKFGEHLSYKSPRFNKVHTPSLWASFITGKSLEEHGIDKWWSWNSFFDWIRKKPPLIWIKNKRKILEKLGVKPKPALKNKADRPETIFDVIKPSIGIDVPTWSLDTEARDWIGKALSISVEEFIKRAWFHHEEKKAKLMEALKAVESKLVREVRGEGLMIGVELRVDVGPILKDLQSRGLLALRAGRTVLRLLPPYLITEEDVETVAREVEGALLDEQSRRGAGGR